MRKRNPLRHSVPTFLCVCVCVCRLGRWRAVRPGKEKRDMGLTGRDLALFCSPRRRGPLQKKKRKQEKRNRSRGRGLSLSLFPLFFSLFYFSAERRLLAGARAAVASKAQRAIPALASVLASAAMTRHRCRCHYRRCCHRRPPRATWRWPATSGGTGPSPRGRRRCPRRRSPCTWSGRRATRPAAAASRRPGAWSRVARSRRR